MGESLSTTYIIPIRVESRDRARNLTASVRFLLKNTTGRIIIKEVDSRQNVPELLSSEIRDNRVRYVYECSSGPFHRTRYLNDMLELVETEIVNNYDADVILPPQAYSQAERMIQDGLCDVVYPYPDSPTGQIRLYFDEIVEQKFLSSSDFSDLKGCRMQEWRAHAGFSFFARKSSYIRVGAENENFVSWGPEDGERLMRFEKLGLRVGRLQSPVLHIEHERGPDSGDENPHGAENWRMHAEISKFTPQDLRLYLQGQEYLARREWRVV